ncbi:MAG: hypothetical protein NZM26_05630 [Patescibacteria group bacterium]|nr:hypothetical protein [Patescibacteria group bacterium]
MSSLSFFNRARKYIESISDINSADPLDKMVYKFFKDHKAYDRAAQALRRRFARGADVVEGIDRGGRRTRIKREINGGSYIYKIEGADGSWSVPEERIWVVAIYAVWQESRKI